MPTFSSILALAALTTSALSGVISPAAKRADDTPELDVQLTQIKGTVVKAIVTNTGDKALNIFNLNFFGDKSPVKKVAVMREAIEVPFGGVRVRPATSALSSDTFTSLAPGASFEDEFDIAFTSDLSLGGPVVLRAQGFVSTTEDGKKLNGVVRYKSNELEFDVDGPAAAKSFAALSHIAKRAKLSSCEGADGDATKLALRDGVDLATRSATEAAAGGARFQEYFKTNDEATRTLVADRFRALANESSSETEGKTSYYCADPYAICTSNVLAYTIPAEDIVVNCPIYYTLIEHLSPECHGQDRVTTTLHEFAHAPGVFSPGTDDLAYGYEAASALTTEEALNNADSFALFAQAINVNC
ncbi:hypothetical protein FQN53_009645 [Emmonsiellopsis sp. PD_33]|nr:hypothetical protein FQN53_009645 [Emmonsiellopsis sp. PD_33]